MKKMYYNGKPITDFSESKLITLGVSNTPNEEGVSPVQQIINAHNQYLIDNLTTQIHTLKPQYDTLLYANITVGDYTYQADEKSQLRIIAFLTSFDGLSADTSLHEMFDDGKIEWTLADNSKVWITKDELSAVKLAIDKRTAHLHIEYNQAKATLEASLEKL